MINEITHITSTLSDEFSTNHIYSEAYPSDSKEDWYTANEVWTVAERYIKSKLQKYYKEVKWLKEINHCELSSVYSFAPLIFQYKNTVFAVEILEHVNNELWEPDTSEINEFLSISTSNNFIPCYIKVFSEVTSYSSKTYVKPTKGLKLIDARTMEEIDPIAIASDEPTLMSELEKFYIALKTIKFALQQKGYRIEDISFFTPFDYNPNIDFYDDKNKLRRVYVRTTNDLKNLHPSKFDNFVCSIDPRKAFGCYLAPVFISGTNGQPYRNQPLNISFFKDIIFEMYDIE